MADQIQVLQTRATANDADANPLPGALIYVYQTGTTTPVTTYTTAALSTPNSNPIVADAAGRFGPIFYGGALQLKIVIKTSAGTTVDTIDPTPKWSATTAAAADITYTPIANNPGVEVQDAIDYISDTYATFIASLATDPLELIEGQFGDGTAASPSITFATSAITGLYYPASNQLGFTVGGVLKMHFTTSALTMASGINILGDPGTAANPGYSFNGDPNTGIYNVGADQIGVSTGGTVRVTFGSSSVTLESGVELLADSGTVSLPGYAFNGDPNTGLYRVSADNMGFVTGGTEWARLASTGSMRFTYLTGDDVTGTASTPGMSIADQGIVKISRDANPPLTLNRFTSDGSIMGFRRSETQVGTISVTTTATAFNTSSDYRLKTVIDAPADFDPISRVLSIDECLTWFEWKKSPEAGPQFGALAHVLAEVAPYAVTGKKDATDPETGGIDPQSVDWSKLVPELIAALAAAHRRIDDLQKIVMDA